MNENLTDITVVLDESGSMADVRTETINGYNVFVGDQRKLPGSCKVTLLKFESWIKPYVFEGRDIKEVPALTEKEYAPGGGTALLDAIGKAINDTGLRLARLPENERPGHVIFVVQTDGEENQSRTFSLDQIRKMIEHQQTKYNWDFVFMGANIDAYHAGGQLGFNPKSTLGYTKGWDREAFIGASNYVSSSRTIGAVNAKLSAADIAAANGQPAPVVPPVQVNVTVTGDSTDGK